MNGGELQPHRPPLPRAFAFGEFAQVKPRVAEHPPSGVREHGVDVNQKNHVISKAHRLRQKAGLCSALFRFAFVTHLAPWRICDDPVEAIADAHFKKVESSLNIEPDSLIDELALFKGTHKSSRSVARITDNAARFEMFDDGERQRVGRHDVVIAAAWYG